MPLLSFVLAAAVAVDAPTLPKEATPDWWTTVQKNIEASEYQVSWADRTTLPDLDAGWQAPNRAHGFRTYFTEHGIRVVPRTSPEPEWEWGLRLEGWGRPEALRSVAGARLATYENRAEYVRDGILEWYVNDSRGLEQGFTVEVPPGDGATLVLEMVLDGTLNPRLSDDRSAVSFVAPGGERVLHYAQLAAWDARGASLPAWFEGFAAEGRRGIRIVVDDAEAAYPVTIDPLATVPVWMYSPMYPAGEFGHSVAAAGDVNGDGYGDLIVGAPYYDSGGLDAGVALVFHGAAGGVFQGPPRKTITGLAGSGLGHSVATAGDVNGDGYGDVIVGAPMGSVSLPEVRVYYGSETGLREPPWSAQGATLIEAFGVTVAPAGDVNGDGFSDVLIGAPGFSGGQQYEGAVFVYYGSASGLSADADWRAESQVGRGAESRAFGVGAASAGDVNGDGYSDIIVGDAFVRSAFVWHGSAAGLGASGDPSNADWSFNDDTMFSLGSDVASAGDVNGDGYSDVLVVAERETATHAEEGRVLLFAGSASGLGAASIWSRVGGQAGAWFGKGVHTAGDVNGDGYADIIVGAPGYDGTYVDGGKVEVFHGGPNGPSASPDWSASGEAQPARFGESVATAGDLNGDGYSDVLVGAPYINALSGKACAYLGGPSGLASTRKWEDEGDQGGAQFGYAVASAGDVNGDGFSEILVGAVLFDDGETNEGKVFLYHGSANGPSGAPNWTATSNDAEARLGYSVASAGDVNGDGYDDIVVGARGYSSSETDEGAAFVWHGSATGLGTTGTPANADWSAQSNQASAYFGIAVGSAGDVNADGYADVIVGATLYDSGQTDEGAVFVWHGSATGLGSAGTPANADWSAQSNQASSRFGCAVGSAGDVNGDGISDVLVGAYAFDNPESNEGKAFVWHGSLNGLGTSGSPSNADWSAESDQAGAYFGFSAAGSGDVNGDGYGDVVVGAYLWDTAIVTDAGKAVGFLGGENGLVAAPTWVAEGTEAAARFGYAVASAGDVNGDGYADVIVGEPYYDAEDGADVGRVLVYEGSASGLPPAASWRRGGAIGGDWYGQAVASAGDVNGDGYGDVILGAPGKDAPDSAEGMAYVLLGNEGLARPLVPMQKRVGTETPIPRLGLSNQSDVFRITVRGLPPFGRGDVKLEWEAVRTGLAFSNDRSAWSSSASWHDSGTTYASLREEVSVTGGLWHWRARVLYDPASSPFQRHGRWFAQPWSGWLDGDLRTIRDGDGDGHRDEYDNCSDVANPGQEDADADGIGNACDSCTDTDGDGFGDPGYRTNTCETDNCPSVSNANQLDADGDDAGDACDTCTDTDGDGFGNPGYPANTCDYDICPTVPDPEQIDSDEDAVGDACDNCMLVDNPGQEDGDADAAGDVCDSCTDSDGDGFGNPGYPANLCPNDNCAVVPNPGQENHDADPDGDACDADDDNDTVLDGADNCPIVANLDQLDADADTAGDACDACTDTDGDGWGNPGYPANTCAADCRPDDLGVWSVPGDPGPLLISKAASDNLVWSAPLQLGGATALYDVLKSRKAFDFGDFEAVCTESDGNDLVATDPTNPAASGEIYYYLVRAQNLCGSNMGTRSSGQERIGRNCP